MRDRLPSLTACAILSCLLLAGGGIAVTARTAAGLDDLLTAADRFDEIRPHLTVGATSRGASDLADDVAHRRTVSDILATLQRQAALLPGLDLATLRARMDGWFAHRADAAFAEDLEGVLRAALRHARAARATADGWALGLCLSAVIAAVAALDGVRRLARRESALAPRAMPLAPLSSPALQPAVPLLPPVLATAAAPARPPRRPPSDSALVLSASELALPLTDRLTGRVLVVEDNPINQRVTQRQLTALGIEARVVGDAETALVQLAEEAWDAVLMDLQLPGIDGLEATRRWRRREIEEARRRLPIIAITANALGSDRDACIEAGMDGYLAKPARLGDLRRGLARFLGAPVPPGPTPSPAYAIHPPAGVEAPMSDVPPLYDRVLWEKLRAETAASDPRMLEELVAELRGGAPRQLETCAQALAGNDLEQVRAIAHRLKGSAGMLGLTRLAQAAKVVEFAARAADAEGVRHGIDQARAALADTMADPAVAALR